MRVPITTAICGPIGIIHLVKILKYVAKTKVEQATTVAVNSIFCHSEENNDRDSSENVDVAVVHMDKIEAIGRDENDSRPWIRPGTVVNEVVIKGLKRRSTENVENSKSDNHREVRDQDGEHH